MIKGNLKRKELVSFYKDTKAETQSKNLEAGTEAEVTECHIVFPSLLPGCHPSPTQAHLPRDGTAHSGLDPPTSISNQKNAPQVNLLEAILQLRFPLPKCVKLTTKIRHPTPFWSPFWSPFSLREGSISQSLPISGFLDHDG